MIEIVRRQMDGRETRGSYPPRFKVGDIIVCVNNDGISSRITRGELYKVGHEGQESYVREELRDGTWVSKTKIYISRLNGTPLNEVRAWNYRFDLAGTLDEPSCTICNSGCKKEEPCPFFISIIKEEMTPPPP